LQAGSRPSTSTMVIIGPLLASPVIFIVGTVSPAYQTYKAVVDKEAVVDKSRWLQYWLIFAIFSTINGVLDMVGEYLPLYWEAKVAFVCWLAVDKFKGASVLFTNVVEKYLRDMTPAIDEQIDFLAARAKNFKADDVTTFVKWASSKDVRAVVDSLSTAAAKKTAALTAAAAKASAAVPEQTTEEKPQEPEEVAEVVDAEDDKKAK